MELETGVQNAAKDFGGHGVLKSFGRRLKWPLQKEDVEKTIQLLERHKTTLITAMNFDQMYEAGYSISKDMYETNTRISLGRLFSILVIS